MSRPDQMDNMISKFSSKLSQLEVKYRSFVSQCESLMSETSHPVLEKLNHLERKLKELCSPYKREIKGVFKEVAKIVINSEVSQDLVTENKKLKKALKKKKELVFEQGKDIQELSSELEITRKNIRKLKKILSRDVHELRKRSASNCTQKLFSREFTQVEILAQDFSCKVDSQLKLINGRVLALTEKTDKLETAFAKKIKKDLDFVALVNQNLQFKDQYQLSLQEHLGQQKEFYENKIEFLVSCYENENKIDLSYSSNSDHPKQQNNFFTQDNQKSFSSFGSVNDDDDIVGIDELGERNYSITE